MLLEGKSVVITGAGSGVGRASALAFAAEGARVVCADVMDDWAKETVRLVEGAGGIAVVQPCDVTREQEVADAVATAVGRFGRLDIMFNNAGVSTPAGAGPFEEYTDADWDRLMNINARGVFYGMKHAIRQFKAQGGPGVIVNTGSVAGLVGWGGTIYGTSKGAVAQMTRAVAIEAAPFGIRVNAICPAAMPTTNFGVHDPGKAFQPKPEEMLKALDSVHPLGEYITPEDCAAAAVFLASDAAHHITGVLLPVDGGYVAR
ncbi:MAG: SDR family oxidoreductase [Acidimicrobiaceae bacterium]|nr:SDR family oxidoreductase [Acidimicrobiaceae bacterium]